LADHRPGERGIPSGVDHRDTQLKTEDPTHRCPRPHQPRPAIIQKLRPAPSAPKPQLSRSTFSPSASFRTKTLQGRSRHLQSQSSRNPAGRLSHQNQSKAPGPFPAPSVPIFKKPGGPAFPPKPVESPRAVSDISTFRTSLKPVRNHPTPPKPKSWPPESVLEFLADRPSTTPPPFAPTSCLLGPGLEVPFRAARSHGMQSIQHPARRLRLPPPPNL
jgi:hypothetical protein